MQARSVILLGVCGICVVGVGLTVFSRTSGSRTGSFVRSRGSSGAAARYLAPGEGSAMGGGRGGRMAAPNAIEAQLGRILFELSRARNPATRKELVQAVRERLEEFRPYLRDMLFQGTGDLLVEAIELAGALPLDGGLPLLIALLFDERPEIRAAVVRNGELFQTWSNARIERFLGDDATEVLLATFAVLAVRSSPKIAWICLGLEHGDLRVREAAVLATPRLHPGEELEALCSFARGTKGSVAISVAEALGRTGLPDAAERSLYTLLERENPQLRRTACDSLASKGATLENPDALVAVLRDPRSGLEDRAHAFAALEKTRTIPVAEIRSLLPGLHPVSKLHAARCLVTAGDASALGVLIELLATEITAEVDWEEQECASGGARRVLAEIAGKDLGTRPEAWRRWHREQGALEPLSLKSEPPLFW